MYFIKKKLHYSITSINNDCIYSGPKENCAVDMYKIVVQNCCTKVLYKSVVQWTDDKILFFSLEMD